MNSKLYSGSILLLLLFSFFLKANAQSPDWLWAKSIGGTGDDFGYAVAIDPSGSGDVYSTGSFGGTVDFDPGPGIFNLDGSGIFISKLDGSGNFVWAKAMSGWGTGYSIKLDPTGNGSIYTTGVFGGTVDFDPGEGEFNLTAGGNDIFISKLDGSGNFVWAKAMGGTNSGTGYSIAIDPSGNGQVYITGNFTGTVDFDPGPGTYNLTSAGVGDIFISKLDAAGNFLWAKALAGTAHDNAHSIAVDPAGGICITGFFRETIDFDPGGGTYNLTSAGGSDIFILKLNSSGNFVWAKAIGSGPDVDDGYCLTVDPSSGNIYITGIFMGTVDFDPGAGIFNLTSSGNYDIYILKLDGSGNFAWANAIGGTNADGGRSITLDPSGSGDVYTSGYFTGTVDFDPGVGEFNLTSAGSYDIFISKLDGSGNFEWAKAIGGGSGEFNCVLSLDDAGNTYVTGSYRSDFVNFGSTTLTNANNSGYTEDIFIAKMSAAPLAIDIFSFKGSFDKNLKGVNLEWITSSETNNDYFTIERSRDGSVFQPIQEVEGAGYSTTIIRYEAFDPNPENGINYYRLRETDYDGKTSNSHIVVVNADLISHLITLYPNPVKNKLTIEFVEVEYPEIKIAFYNILGKIVFSEKGHTIDSRHTIDISSLAAGIYTVELNMNGNKVVKKVLKQ